MTMTDKRACLLFDIDGTLVDTDKVHIIAFNEMLKPFGVEVDEHFYFKNISGRTNPVILAELLPDLTPDHHQRLSVEKEALFRSMATVIEPIPGLLELFDFAEQNNIPYAAVTKAPGPKVVRAPTVMRPLERPAQSETYSPTCTPAPKVIRAPLRKEALGAMRQPWPRVISARGST